MKIISKKILSSSAGSILILLAFLAVLNFLAVKNSYYLDLTEDKIYTVSQATKDILKSLDGEVNVNFYISKDLPVDLLNVKTQLVDLMNQYRDISESKLKISYIEPENSSEKARELAQKGIPQIQFNVIEKDSYEVKQGFFGAEITSGKEGEVKREVIPIVQSIGDLEYDFISAVYSVSKDEKETLAFLNGHGEKDLHLSDLEKSYEVRDVRIKSEGDKKGFFVDDGEMDVPKTEGEDNSKSEKEEFVNPITLIIVGPKEKISKEEIAVVNDYIKKGGNVVVLSEAVAPDINDNLNARAVDNGLNELTKKYGIEINSDLVYDKSNTNITYRQGFFSVSKPYPFWIRALQDNFGAYPSLSGVQSVVFPWASSLSLRETDTYLAKPLVSTTRWAGNVSGSYDLMPNRSFDFFDVSQRAIAAFAEPKNKDQKSGSLIVIADSDFVSPDFISQFPDNRTFFMNLIDSVSNTANLSSIRSKNIADRPLKELPESDKNSWKLASIFGGALLVDIYGVFRIVRRKRRNK
jgi:gliding-associated putative ABC transporter substrate-binding component GldG